MAVGLAILFWLKQQERQLQADADRTLLDRCQ
jgi:hypothetical protein